jgi:hypothetical protein
MMPAHQDILVAVTSGVKLVCKFCILVVFEIRIDIESESLTQRFDGQLRTLALVGILRCE